MTGSVLTSLSEDGVATITLNRPEARNALNMDIKGALADAIAWAASEPAARAVVITGAGDAFSAGGDIKEMALNDTPVTSRARLQKLLATVFVPLSLMEKPTVAAVNGAAHGAGLSLALACDIILVADDAKLSCAFTKVGLLPDCGSLYFLPRRVGVGVAKELIFTGRALSAAEAVELRLANRSVPKAELLSTAHELASSFASSATVALGLAKRLLDQSSQSTLGQMSELEALAQAVLFATDDHLAARTAFAAKEKPVFTGR